MNILSRREFIIRSAALSAAFPFVKLSAKADPAGKGARNVEDYVFSSAVDVAQAIRRGDISSLELTELMFRRIDAINPQINAVVTLMREEALARAREADVARAKGKFSGPLHGVPVTVKDAFDIKGVRITYGMPAFKDHIATRDAAVVERLRRAGAVLLGVTNVPFMLNDHQSYNDIFGQTNNPWDLTRTPGGSTGGGAAALAAGLGYLTPGSDIGGSIRCPAHFCGVCGHKPTLNVVPTRGHMQFSPDDFDPPNYLAVAGPLARYAKDLRLALEVLGGPDGDEAVAYNWKLPSPRQRHLKDYRLGYLLDDKLCPVSSDVRAMLADAVTALRNAGATLTEGWPEGVDPEGEYHNFFFLLQATFAFETREEKLAELRDRAKKQDGTWEYFNALAQAGPHKTFIDAQSKQMKARANWQDFFRTHDAFLLPTAFVPAFKHDHRPWKERILETPEGPRRYGDLLFWISFATHTGHPATVVPVGLTKEGLPVGAQIIGPYLEDDTSIDLAMKIEELLGGFHPPKGY
ncbi:amidase [bacterium]|nr:amidase [bacterium]